MCIISNPVETVSQTKILVAPSKDKTRQLTIYSNQVNNTSESNAMILPVPNPSSVKFVDLSAYKHIFTDVDRAFYKPQTRSYESKIRLSFGTNSAKLQVFNVGSYKASLAMNFEDLKRVDDSVFKLSSGCCDLLKESYDESY
jgi:hypothetical protein